MNTNRVVRLHADAALISSLGGPTAVARRLGLKGPKGARRVNNWRYRGIPEVLLLRHPEAFADMDEAGASAQHRTDS